jgi:hypothetical protein
MGLITVEFEWENVDFSTVINGFIFILEIMGFLKLQNNHFKIKTSFLYVTYHKFKHILFS